MHAKTWILTALLLGAAAAPAAAAPLFVYVSEEAVFLRYAEDSGDLPDGYHVYRRAVADGSWTRLTPDPVAPIFDADRLRGAAGLAADVFIEMLGGDAKTRRLSREDYNRVLQDPDGRNFLMILTFSYPALSRALGQQYVDTEVQPGAAFEYRVTALRGGGETEVALGGPYTHGQPTSLPAPSGLTVVEEGDGQVYLDWARDKAAELEHGIVGYNLYRAQGDVTRPFLRVNGNPVMDVAVSGGEDPARAFRDGGLDNGTVYWYRAAAVNVFGFEGEPGEPVRAVPRDEQTPPPVEDLGFLLTPGAVILQWSAVEDPGLRGYRVHRSLGGIDAFEQVAPARGPAHTGTVFVDSLITGQTAWYRVQAVDRAGNAGPFSNAVQVFAADVIPPERVTGLAADIDAEGHVALSWDAAEAGDLLGYRLQRSTSPEENDEAWMTIADELKDAAFTDTLWQFQEGEVSYRVRAQDLSDNRGLWSEWVTVRPPDRLPPRPPFLQNVTVEGDRLVLTWRRNTEADFRGVHVWRSATEQGGYQKLTPRPLADTLTTWADTEASLNAVNWYRLSGVDMDGNESEPGNPMGATFYDDVPPPAPEGLAAASDSTGIVLTWSPSPAGDIKGFRIYRQGEGDSEAVFYRNIKGETVRFLDRDVAEGGTYAYQIAAFDTAFNFSPRTPLVLVIHDPGSRDK